MPPDVVTFGEALGVIRGRGPLRLGGQVEMSIAGAEANVAIGLARLGHRCQWIGRVGNDEPGELVQRTLRAENVDVSGVRVDDQRPTALMLADQRLNMITRVNYYRAGSAGSDLRAEDVLASVTAGVRIVHVTGITAAISASARDAVLQGVCAAKEAGATVSLDVNHRNRLWSVVDARAALLPLLPLVDVLFASDDELPVLARDHVAADAATLANDLLRTGVREVVVKRGRDGACVWTRDGSFCVDALPVTAVDVVGAGDAFVAGYLSGWLDGLAPLSCAERGTATAAFAVARHGDWEGLPSRAELHLAGLTAEATLR